MTSDSYIPAYGLEDYHSPWPKVLIEDWRSPQPKVLIEDWRSPQPKVLIEDWRSPQFKVLIEDVPMVDPYLQQLCERPDTDDIQYDLIPNKPVSMRICARRQLMPGYEEGPLEDAPGNDTPLAFALDDQLFPEIDDPASQESGFLGVSDTDWIAVDPQDVSNQESDCHWNSDNPKHSDGVDVLCNSGDGQDLISFCEEMMSNDSGSSIKHGSFAMPHDLHRRKSHNKPKAMRIPRRLQEQEQKKKGYGLSVDDAFYFDGSKFVSIKIITDGTGSFRLILPKTHPHNKGLPEDVPIFSASSQLD